MIQIAELVGCIPESFDLDCFCYEPKSPWTFSLSQDYACLFIMILPILIAISVPLCNVLLKLINLEDIAINLPFPLDFFTVAYS